VVLVNMPLASVARPSLGLGLLKALLADEGIACRVLNPNLWFVEFIGLANYSPLMAPRVEECIGDWLFAGVAFPEFEPDHEGFLGLFHLNHPDLLGGSRESQRELLMGLRERMGDFVDWVADEVLCGDPRVVGCTSIFQQHVSSLALLRRIRERAPDVVTIMGGANCESVMGRTTHEHFPWVDFVVSGEADELAGPLFRGILQSGRALEADRVPEAVFAPVHRRVGYRRSPAGDGYARGTVRDVARLPLPDFDEYFHRDLPDFAFRDWVRASLVYESSRGCWWGERSHCTFCGLNGGGMAFRSKPADQAAREIGELVSRYGVTRVQTVDNIIDLSYFESLLPLLEDREPALSVFYETKANLTREQVAAFARAGVRWIQPGIESLHTGALRLMRKGVSAWQNVRLLKWCRQFGVRCAWSQLVGFPAEEDAWYAQVATLVPLLEHLQPGGFSQLRFDRYSPYHAEAAERGLRLRPCRQYAFVYPLEPGAMRDLAYYFADPEQRLVEGMIRGERPGAKALWDAMAAWRARWPGDLPRLEWRRDGTGRLLGVLDERRCAVATHHALSPAETRVLEALDAGISRRRLVETVAGSAAAPEAEGLRAALDSLVAKKLVVEVDDRCISLVLDAPGSYPDESECPAGGISDANLEANRRERLARVAAA